MTTLSARLSPTMALLLALPCGACGRTILDLEGEEGSSGTGPDPAGDTSEGREPATTGGSSGAVDDGPAPPEVCRIGAFDCTPKVDVLLVIDNSRSMGEEQRVMARSAAMLVEAITRPNSTTEGPELDTHVMVTTTDMSNPLCVAYQPPGYEPARGAPVSTPCLERLDDFVDLTGTIEMPEACIDMCPEHVGIEGRYLEVSPEGSNVANVPTPLDLDGDGQIDPPEARALACMIPQGINGCGFESPLHAMRTALDPFVEWNEGDDPFLREDAAALVIVLLTDEVDCSIADAAVMSNPALQNVNPDTGMTTPSSAICWNAGTSCVGPDAFGVYASCSSLDAGYLHEVETYYEFLDQLRQATGKEVIMAPIVGVPLVWEHNPEPPFEAIGGGLYDLLYRDWMDAPYPSGDITPDEWDQGIRAAHKQFEFGIGPGCTGVDLDGNFTSQALPPVRIRELCGALDRQDDAGNELVRCSVESICDTDYLGSVYFIAGSLSTPWQGFPG